MVSDCIYTGLDPYHRAVGFSYLFVNPSEVVSVLHIIPLQLSSAEYKVKNTSEYIDLCIEL
jgi:hypothetical protein